MKGTAKKTLRFSSDEPQVTIPSASPNNMPLKFAGNYSDFMAQTFGEIHINPVGFSTPDPGTAEENPLSGSSYCSQS